MLEIRLAEPFVGLVVNRNGLLGRRDTRIFNRDRYVRDAASALLVERYGTEVVASSFGDDEQSPLIRFLEWLLENQEAIKAFIEMIMSLFVVSSEKKNVL